MGAGGMKGSGAVSEINVTPLVDVMLVLLIIFMVATPLAQKAKEERQVKMNLPVTRDNPDHFDPDQIKEAIFKIDKDLIVYLGDTILVDCSSARNTTNIKDFETCFEKIEASVLGNQKLQKEKEIYLLADVHIPYGFVVGTMARLKKAGVEKIGMVTNPEYLDK